MQAWNFLFFVRQTSQVGLVQVDSSQLEGSWSTATALAHPLEALISLCGPGAFLTEIPAQRCGHTGAWKVGSEGCHK